MKKIYLVILIAFISYSINAQKRIGFGVTGGLFYGNADVSTTGVDIASLLILFDQDADALEVLDGGGFYVGLLADIKVIGKLYVQPELLYANAAGESVFIVPIMAKYYVTNSLNFLAGPQLDFMLNVPTEVEDFVDALGYSIAIGAGYDINKKIAIQTKYALGLSNRIDDAIVDALGSVKPSLKTNILQLGVVYKF